MAADILAILLKSNLAAAAAILLALALRKPARKAFGAGAAYRLWLGVPLAAGAVLLPARSIVLPYVAQLGSATDTLAPVVATGPVAATAPATPVIDNAVLIALWLGGAAISLALLIWSQSRFMKSLGGVVREGQFLRAKAPSAGPAVIGAVFPRIVLPADFETRYDPAEQTVVLAHEAAHLASGDAAVNAVTALARCLFWFNPLVHIAARVLRVDQELACDAAVLLAHPQMRRPYAEALLKTQLASTPLPLGCYWPAGASHPLKERIAMLKFGTPSRARRLCGGAGILALCLGAGAAAWAAQPATVTVSPAPVNALESLAAPTPPVLRLAATDMAQTAQHPAATPTNAVTSSVEPGGQRTRSSNGNTYQRIDADPIPARLYALWVTLPDGTSSRLISPLPALRSLPNEETEEVRAAKALYASAKEEEAARLARGAEPQPFTPALESALRVMSDFEPRARARRLAEFEAKYDRISVPANGRQGTVTYTIPKNFTSAAKAQNLASLDKIIAITATRKDMQDAYIKIREIVAARSTTD